MFSLSEAAHGSIAHLRLVVAMPMFLALVSCAQRDDGGQPVAAATGIVGSWQYTGPAEGGKGFGPPSKVVFKGDGKCVLDWGKQGRYKIEEGDLFEVTVYEFASTLVTKGRYLRESDEIEVFENRYKRVPDGP